MVAAILCTCNVHRAPAPLRVVVIIDRTADGGQYIRIEHTTRIQGDAVDALLRKLGPKEPRAVRDAVGQLVEETWTAARDASRRRSSLSAVSRIQDVRHG